MTKSYEVNKLGFGLRLPNLPKQDYLLLKERSNQWSMSFIQIILLGLRAIEYLPEEKWDEMAKQAIKDV